MLCATSLAFKIELFEENDSMFFAVDTYDVYSSSFTVVLESCFEVFSDSGGSNSGIKFREQKITYNINYDTKFSLN